MLGSTRGGSLGQQKYLLHMHKPPCPIPRAKLIILLFGIVTALLATTTLVLKKDMPPNPVVRTTTLGMDPIAVGIDARTERGFILAQTPVGPHWSVAPGVVMMLDLPSGKLLRTVVVGRAPKDMAVDVRDGHVFVINAADDSLSMLDAQSGTVTRTFNLSRSSPIDAIGLDSETHHIFVVTDDGMIRMLDANNGRMIRIIQLHRVSMSEPLHLAVDTQADRVVVADPSDATVSVLDARHNIILRRTILSPDPDINGVAVDARTGRVVVTGYIGLALLNENSGHVVEQRNIGTIVAQVATDEQNGRAIITAHPMSNTKVSLAQSIARIIAADGRPATADPAIVPLAVDDHHSWATFCTTKGLQVIDIRSATPHTSIKVDGCDAGVAIDSSTSDVVTIAHERTVSQQGIWAWVPLRIRQWLSLTSPPPHVVPGRITVVHMGP